MIPGWDDDPVLHMDGASAVEYRREQSKLAADEHYIRLHCAEGHHGMYRECRECKERGWR